MLGASLTAIFAGTALAAEMTAAEAKAFLSGRTTYAETSATAVAGAGQTTIFWAADGTVVVKAPNGDILHGKWSLEDNTSCIQVDGQQTTSCSRYDKQGDATIVIDASTGLQRAKITKSADGNSEKLGQ